MQPQNQPERVSYSTIFDECIVGPNAKAPMYRRETEKEAVRRRFEENRAKNREEAGISSKEQQKAYTTLLENYDLLNFIHCECPISDGCLFPVSKEQEDRISEYFEKSKESSFSGADRLFVNIVNERPVNYEQNYYVRETGEVLPSSVLCYNSNTSALSLEEVKLNANKTKDQANRFVAFEKEALNTLVNNFQFLDSVYSLPAVDGEIHPLTAKQDQRKDEYLHALANSKHFEYADKIFNKNLSLRKHQFDRSFYDFDKMEVVSSKSKKAGMSH